MILDTSAIVAIMLREPGHEALQAKLASAAAVGVGAPTLVETAIVLSARLSMDAGGLLARFLQETSALVVPFGEAHYAAAHRAWMRLGKGRHPAGLNLGDCATYATALLAQEPLLCTGDDFPRTDLDLA
ncbi:MAG: type II toxin-antitoxin system VapC family toxin [Candidatus Latescibacterota bacterium]